MFRKEDTTGYLLLIRANKQQFSLNLDEISTFGEAYLKGKHNEAYGGFNLHKLFYTFVKLNREQDFKFYLINRVLGYSVELTADDAFSEIYIHSLIAMQNTKRVEAELTCDEVSSLLDEEKPKMHTLAELRAKVRKQNEN
jgi:hypothetical protein